MIILSHRGYWKDKLERNQAVSFERSFELNFGTETDVRDFNGELVISHDIADEKSLALEAFFKIYKRNNHSLPLALNVKSDGLQVKLHKLLLEYNIINYFVFDMSIPDGLQYIKQGVRVFTRSSEYEKEPSFYDDASGVWLDEFKGHWITKDVIQKYTKGEKQICIVSPDLHQREYKNEWIDYKKIEQDLGINNIMICTDYPEEAREFFNE